jgi:hypothetical protein
VLALRQIPFPRSQEEKPMDLTSIEDVEDSVEGGVIESLEFRDNGIHINLVDGGILVFPDAKLVAIHRPERDLQ